MLHFLPIFQTCEGIFAHDEDMPAESTQDSANADTVILEVPRNTSTPSPEEEDE